MLCITMEPAAKPEMFQKMLSYHSEIAQQTRNKLVALLMEREKIGDTCIADGIALAHTQSDFLTVPVYMAAQLKAAVPWDENGNTVSILILLLVPTAMSAEFLQQIRQLMVKLADETVTEKMLQARSAEELSNLLVL